MAKKTMRQLFDEQKPPAEEISAEYKYPKLENYPHCPPLPTDLTKTEYRKLGSLYSRYTSFMAYLNEQIAEKKFQLTRLKIMRRRRRAAVIYSARGMKLMKLAAATKDPEVMEVDERILKEGTRVAAYMGLMWTMKDFLRAIEFERDRRSQGYRANVEDYGDNHKTKTS